MNKAYVVFRWLVLALIVSGCSIEIDQATQTPPTESVPATSPTTLFPTTQIPVIWAHLNLTGKLIYPGSTRENDTVTGNLQVLDLATGDLETIFSIPRGWIYYTTLSPDAKSIVMSYAPPAQPNTPANRILYIMPLDASLPPQPLFTPPTPDDRYTQVEWAPDGRYVYFVHYNNETRPSGQLDPIYDILRIRYPDGQSERIADHAFWPRISSDSSKLVYISVDPVSGKNGLVVANADGSDPQEIAFSNSLPQEIIDAPIFSPDGQSILFSVPSQSPTSQRNWFETIMGIRVAKAHDVPSDWWTVPVGGGVPTRLTNIQTINLFASISPDGNRIASLSGDGLFVMDLDGSNLSQLIADPAVHGTVSWIP